MNDLVKLQLSSDKLNSIALLRKKGGLAMDVVYVKLQKTVLDIFDYYGESVNNTQFDMLISDLENIGFMLNGADMDIFADNCKRGKYKNRVDFIDGKEFAIKFFKLTPDVLIDWLKVYIYERGEVFANIQIKPKNEVITESQAKVVDIFANSIPKTKEVVICDEDKEKLEIKELVFKIHNEYKALQMEQDSRLVEVNGKHYDYNEFLKLRTT